MLAARGFEDLVAAHAAGQDRPEIPPGMIRLGSNENPYGPGPHVVAAVERALHDDGNRYTRLPQLLTGRLASMLSVSGGSLLVSAGSGDLLRAAVLAYVTADKPLVAATPTFETPVRTAESLRLPLRLVPLTAALSNDLDRMAEQGKGAGLVYVCNPDNPTGTFHAKTAIVAFIETLASTSPETVVMIDEAYFDCADDRVVRVGGDTGGRAAQRRGGQDVLEDSRPRGHAHRIRRGAPRDARSPSSVRGRRRGGLCVGCRGDGLARRHRRTSSGSRR